MLKSAIAFSLLCKARRNVLGLVRVLTCAGTFRSFDASVCRDSTRWLCCALSGTVAGAATEDVLGDDTDKALERVSSEIGARECGGRADPGGVGGRRRGGVCSLCSAALPSATMVGGMLSDIDEPRSEDTGLASMRKELDLAACGGSGGGGVCGGLAMWRSAEVRRARSARRGEAGAMSPLNDPGSDGGRVDAGVSRPPTSLAIRADWRPGCSDSALSACISTMWIKNCEKRLNEMVLLLVIEAEESLRRLRSEAWSTSSYSTAGQNSATQATEHSRMPRMTRTN